MSAPLGFQQFLMWIVPGDEYKISGPMLYKKVCDGSMDKNESALWFNIPVGKFLKGILFSPSPSPPKCNSKTEFVSVETVSLHTRYTTIPL